MEKNHSKIGKLVQENLDKLDDKTLIEMIENNVGKDLQWIRVNGAVCGFMIGLVLEGIKAII
ncbi:Predicted membrane protein [Streptococcus pneumoniae]|nr:Predicted membrane protein [Streptococcus pneumoniae]